MAAERRSAETGAADRKTLEKIIDRFADTPVLVVGDVVIDHYVWGTVNRVSPEAPVVVVNVTREDRRLGGAGNVARNIASLGGRPLLCATVGEDEAGRSVAALLAEIAESPRAGLIVDSTRPTIVKSRVIAHSQQVVRIDYEKVSPLRSDLAVALASTVERAMPTVSGVVVSDYGKGTVGEPLFATLRARPKSLPVLVDPKSPNFPFYRGSTVVKPNRSEAAQASGISVTDRSTAADAGRKLLTEWQCEMVLITLGEEGMVLVSSPDPTTPAIEVDTVAQEVFDVSGAGDTVSAVFTLALAVGASPEQAALLANCAAGVVVGEVGTAAVSPQELKERLHSERRAGID